MKIRAVVTSLALASQIFGYWVKGIIVNNKKYDMNVEQKMCWIESREKKEDMKKNLEKIIITGLTKHYSKIFFDEYKDIRRKYDKLAKKNVIRYLVHQISEIPKLIQNINEIKSDIFGLRISNAINDFAEIEDVVGEPYYRMLSDEKIYVGVLCGSIFRKADWFYRKFKRKEINYKNVKEIYPELIEVYSPLTPAYNFFRNYSGRINWNIFEKLKNEKISGKEAGKKIWKKITRSNEFSEFLSETRKRFSNLSLGKFLVNHKIIFVKINENR